MTQHNQQPGSADLTKAEIDAIVYQCRQSGADTTYDIVNAAIAAAAAPSAPVAQDQAKAEPVLYAAAKDFPLAPGDEIMCSVKELAPDDIPLYRVPVASADAVIEAREQALIDVEMACKSAIAARDAFRSEGADKCDCPCIKTIAALRTQAAGAEGAE